MAKGDKGREFLTSVLQKVPEAQRADAQALVNQILASDVLLGEIETGVARHQEYSSGMDANRAEKARLQAHRQELVAWADTKEAELEARNAALTEREKTLEKPTLQTPAIDETKVVSVDKYTRDMQTAEANFVGFVSEMTTIATRHLKQFNEVLDTKPILQHPKVRELGIDGVYQLLHKEQLDAANAAATAAAEKKIRDDERAKVMAEVGKSASNLPYPVTGYPGVSVDDDLSPLRVLDPAFQAAQKQNGAQPANPMDGLAERAAAQFAELVNSRGAAGR